MNFFLVHIELPEFSEEMAQVLISQKEHALKLLQNGTLVSLSVGIMMEDLWLVIKANSEQEAMEIVSTLPLHAYFKDVSCSRLLMHLESAGAYAPLSLN